MSRESRKRKAKKSIYIITEGQTEEKYFNLLKQEYRASGITIKAIKPCAHKIISQAKELFKKMPLPPSQKTRKVVVIDKDALTRSDFEKVEDDAEKNNIDLFFSNETFEVWLLAHFEVVNSGFFPVNKLKDKLTKYLQQEYKKADSKQLEKIIENHKRAIENTKHINVISYDKQCTNIGSLCEDIIS